MFKNSPAQFIEKHGIIPFTVGLIAGLCFFTFRIIDFNFLYFAGDLGDARLNLYFLEHAHKFFTGKLESYWNAPFMYPEPNVLSYSDNLLGSAPIYSFFRLLGIDTITSYQCWYLVINILNYTAAYLLLKKLFGNSYAAVLGAMVFAFSIALQSQLTHSQTFPRYAIPLAFLFAISYTESFKPKYFFLTVFSVVYQIYCGIYLGLMLCIPVSIYLVLSVLKQGKSIFSYVFNGKCLFQILGSLALNVLLLIPLIHPYFQRKISPNYFHYLNLRHSIPTIKSHFYADTGSLLWIKLKNIGETYEAWWDHQLFAGGIATMSLLVCMVLMGKSLYKNRLNLSQTRVPFMLILTAVITKLFFIRFGNFSAYYLIYYFPGFSALRSITRIINIELLFFAIATAFVFVKIFERKRKYTFAIFILCLGLLVCDNYFLEDRVNRTKKSVAYERTSRLDSLMSGFPTGTIISYEPQTKDLVVAHNQLDAMLVAQCNDLLCVNGYTATSPLAYSRYWNEMNEESRNFWLLNNKLEFDTLIVITSDTNYFAVSATDIQIWKEENPDLLRNDIEKIIENLKKDEKSMQMIKEKARMKNIPLDSAIKLDAQWILDNQSN